MFCVSCGKELPNDANFCLKCGKPQRPNISAVLERPERWERCEIKWATKQISFFSSNYDLYFWADAAGSDGTYKAGESEHLVGGLVRNNHGTLQPYGRDEKKVRPTLDAFIKKLNSEGWELIDCGSDWFNYRFRRRLT